MDPVNLGFTKIPLEDIGYLAIFLIMVVDGANIPFTPNELFVAFTGYLARTGEVNTAMAYGVCILGSLTGNLISFSLGWKIGRPFFDRYGKFVLITQHRLKDAEGSIKRFKIMAPFVVRFIPGLRNIGSLLLGIFRFPPGFFILLTAAGIVIYNGIFFLTGFVLAEQLTSARDLIVPLVISIVAGGLMLAAIAYYRNRQPETGNEQR